MNKKALVTFTDKTKKKNPWILEAIFVANNVTWKSDFFF